MAYKGSAGAHFFPSSIARKSIGRVIDVCPDSGALLVESSSLLSCRQDEARLIKRAPLLRRYAMRAAAFYMLARDCGLRYALTFT
jgi:hypothetical protein